MKEEKKSVCVSTEFLATVGLIAHLYNSYLDDSIQQDFVFSHEAAELQLQKLSVEHVIDVIDELLNVKENIEND